MSTNIQKQADPFWLDRNTFEPCPQLGNRDCTITRPEHRHVAAQSVLRSSFIAERLREAKLLALREAGIALNVEALSLKPGGWGSNPADQQTLGFAAAVMRWLSNRADRIESGDLP